MNDWMKWIIVQTQEWERKYGHYTIEELENLYDFPDDLNHYFNCWLTETINKKRQLTNS